MVQEPPEVPHHLHHQFQMRTGFLHPAFHPEGVRRLPPFPPVRRTRERRRVHDPVRGVSRQQGGIALVGRNVSGSPLSGRTVFFPPMNEAGVRTISAAFRSVGIEARAMPPSGEETLLLGGGRRGGGW